MATLVLDSSHKYLAVGVIKNDELVASKQDILRQKQSEFLVTYIKEVLEMAKIDKKEIDTIVLTQGPGSYTGLRIAMTFAKVFALTQDIEIYTINTLLSLSGLNNGFCLIDARSKRVFGAYIENGHVVDEKIYKIDEIKNLNIDFIGDVELLNREAQAINVIKNILDLKFAWTRVENIDLLVPNYYQ